MSFYCRKCESRFPLPWRENDSPESYSERLTTVKRAKCPRCGRWCCKCKLKGVVPLLKPKEVDPA